MTMTPEDLVYGATANLFGSDTDPLPVGIRLDLDAEHLRSRLSHPEALTPEKAAQLQHELQVTEEAHQAIGGWPAFADCRSASAF